MVKKFCWAWKVSKSRKNTIKNLEGSSTTQLFKHVNTLDKWNRKNIIGDIDYKSILVQHSADWDSEWSPGGFSDVDDDVLVGFGYQLNQTYIDFDELVTDKKHSWISLGSDQ
ncbi:hypothetical protein GCK72_025248 [Caenorhabditis remanei]|uniref:Uncharacterized protein n=1 Tax=Caenorhabditis remanei TaxID=31234 RepID=A0A6A5G1Y9_CAERE|nr:hypothetical protein GCK72_025248 [Caenorhabditis remanei]KAF1748781.1 hypothetical protein GCK72_025248 [Caenorhabditis remanei]